MHLSTFKDTSIKGTVLNNLAMAAVGLLDFRSATHIIQHSGVAKSLMRTGEPIVLLALLRKFLGKCYGNRGLGIQYGYRRISNSSPSANLVGPVQRVFALTDSSCLKAR